MRLACDGEAYPAWQPSRDVCSAATTCSECTEDELGEGIVCGWDTVKQVCREGSAMNGAYHVERIELFDLPSLWHRWSQWSRSDPGWKVLREQCEAPVESWYLHAAQLMLLFAPVFAATTIVVVACACLVVRIRRGRKQVDTLHLISDAPAAIEVDAPARVEAVKFVNSFVEIPLDEGGDSASTAQAKRTWWGELVADYTRWKQAYLQGHSTWSRSIPATHVGNSTLARGDYMV